MCDFVSWIEWQGQKYYLTGNDLLTPEGAAMLKSVFRCDLAGHGAIRAYYPELHDHGINKECVDFSSPANFPTEIADVIKAGMFRGIGYDLRLPTEAASIRWSRDRVGVFEECHVRIRNSMERYEGVRRISTGDPWAPEVLAARSQYDLNCENAWMWCDSELNNRFWDIFMDPANRTQAWR